MRLDRLFSARSIAVIGGGAWCASIIGAARRIGFEGDIFPVHPQGKQIAGLTALRTLSDWQGPIDAAFIGVNRHATLEVVSELAALGAGGHGSSKLAQPGCGARRAALGDRRRCRTP